MSQRGLIAAAALVALAAGFVLGRGCAPPTTTPVPAISRTSPDARAPDTPRTADPAARDRSSPRRANAATNDVSGATPAPESSDSPAPGDEDFPFADIEVVWPDASPAAGAIVYALPAGGSAPEDAEPPRADTDSKGRARLHVLSPGRYDVGGLLGAFQVLAADVEFPTAAPLRLVLPEPCTVTVRMPDRGGPEPGHEGEGQFCLRLRIDAAETRSYPGRGETSCGFAESRVRNGLVEWLATAPRGAACRIDHDRRFRVEPETFVAPAEVRVVTTPRYRVRIDLDPQPGDRRFAAATSIGVYFTREEGSTWTWCWSERIPPGTPVGKIAASAAFDAEFDRPSGRLNWTGAGLVPGSLPFFDLSPDSTTTLTARVVLDPQQELPVDAPPLEQPPAARTGGHAVRVSGSDVPGDAEIEIYAINAEGGGDDEYVARGALWHTAVESPRWVLAAYEDYVSEAIDLPESPAGEVELGLVRGGYLVVVPENMPPAGLGVPQIVRADGRPFLFGSACAGLAYQLEVGARLGPFPPGTVEFKVTLAGRTLATVRAVVRAGTHEVLRIPRLRAQ